MSKISREDLDETGLPDTVRVELSLEFGLAYVYFGDRTKIAVSQTLADCRPGINLDLDAEGSVVGLEDISKEMFTVVSKWVEALKSAKKRVAKKEIK